MKVKVDFYLDTFRSGTLEIPDDLWPTKEKYGSDMSLYSPFWKQEQKLYAFIGDILVYTFNKDLSYIDKHWETRKVHHGKRTNKYQLQIIQLQRLH